jgi:hypothetical protein
LVEDEFAITDFEDFVHDSGECAWGDWKGARVCE